MRVLPGCIQSPVEKQHFFKHYESDEHLRMDDNYEKATHLKARVGQAVQEDATEGVHKITFPLNEMSRPCVHLL